MSIAEKLTTIAENQEKVYEAGKLAEYDEFWDSAQNYGSRQDYNRAFQGGCWTVETLKPKYNIKPTTAYQMFHNCNRGNTEQIKMSDLGVTIDFSQCTDMYEALTGQMFSELSVIDLSSATANNSTYGVFYDGYYSPPLRKNKIEKIIVNENTPIVNSWFGYCTRLTYLRVEGVIAQSINLSWSPLDVDSMKSVILCLKDYSGTDKEYAYKVQFTSDCWDALEADSTSPDGGTWKDYVYQKGWNY